MILKADLGISELVGLRFYTLSINPLTGETTSECMLGHDGIFYKAKIQREFCVHFAKQP